MSHKVRGLHSDVRQQGVEVCRQLAGCVPARGHLAKAVASEVVQDDLVVICEQWSHCEVPECKIGQQTMQHNDSVASTHLLVMDDQPAEVRLRHVLVLFQVAEGLQPFHHHPLGFLIQAHPVIIEAGGRRSRIQSFIADGVRGEV